MKKALLIGLLLAICACTVLPAQTFSLITGREPVTSLDGLWRFHTGDNPAWANPSFDDSQWPLIRSGESWNQQGYPKLTGFAWYRARIVIPAGESNLSLYLPYVITSYQVFADGARIGGLGGMPPHTYPITQFLPAAAYRLPLRPAPQVRTLVIAIRVWHWPGWQSLLGGGIYPGARIGETGLIEDLSASGGNSTSRRTANPTNHAGDIFLAFLEMLAGFAALGFFIARPREKEYGWFMAAIFLAAGAKVAVASYVAGHLDVRVFNLSLALLDAAFAFAQIGFFSRLLVAKRNWLFWTAIGSVSAQLLLNLPILIGRLISSGPSSLSLIRWNEIASILPIPIAVWILSLTAERAKQGLFDARLLLAPVLLQQLASLTDSFLWIAHFVLHWNPESYRWFYVLSASPIAFSVSDLTDLLFLVGMLAIFVYRFTRTSRQEDEHNRELEAARTVQNVLVPDEIPPISGFSIQSVYRPAGQVGGDFFQILQIQGGAMIVIGDVSGKGMPAAMTVSLLVGTVRTLARYTQSPGEILKAMNQLMLTRSNGGFTTCLALRADADGTIVAANAGHLPPYIGGKEMLMDNGLPLGLSAESSYSETSLTLADDAQLTLLTDGVIEARNSDGELFGFDRTAAIAAEPVETIVRAAQVFGQQDDITVLTVARAPKLEAIPA